MHWPEGWAEANLPARRRLMANGLHFTRAQCNTAACSSSRATFFTGLYPAQHGVKNLVSCNNYRDPVQRRISILPSSLPNLAKLSGRGRLSRGAEGQAPPDAARPLRPRRRSDTTGHRPTPRTWPSATDSTAGIRPT